MAVNKKDIEEFEDMFDIPSSSKEESGDGGSESNSDDQSDEYGKDAISPESFDKLSEEVAETIKDASQKGYVIKSKEDPLDIIKDVCVSGNVVNITDSKSNIPKPEKVESPVDDDDFFEEEVAEIKDVVEVKDVISNDTDILVESDSLIGLIDAVDSTSTVTDDDLFDDPGSTDDLDSIIDIIDDSDSDTVDDSSEKEDSYKISEMLKSSYGEVGYGEDKIEWMLEAPSSMYNSFYQKKRDFLFKYMVGGQVEYKRWTQELEEAHVAIRGEIFDHQLIIDQMEAVQQHRERVKAIHVRVNNQYFTFKRFVEMMRGFLARVEYLKPVARQEGLIMEHMRDLELYYARLEALHDSATKTEKTLAAAFDTLSRKCTICMELRPAERVDVNKYEKTAYVPKDNYKVEPVVRQKSADLDKFDDLPSKATASPVGYKTGAISWGDI